MNEEVIRWHLSGKDKVGQDFVAGIYPMLADETCYFLAVPRRLSFSAVSNHSQRRQGFFD